MPDSTLPRHNLVGLFLLATVLFIGWWAENPTGRDFRRDRTDGLLAHQLHSNASVFLLPLWLAGLGHLIFASRAVR
ncbi:MAG TPA: hypothetical protein VFN13_07200 [Rudaea sp.]|nr:hypothetical protein [Rudaea sp.]